jgi:NADH-quinone oxidoreductase subunit M
MLNHGVSTGALFLIVGMLSERRHTRQIAEFGGLKAVMPQLVAVFLVITLSSIGLPGLNGFVGEFLILAGAFRWDPWFAVVAASGVILSAVYMLWMFQRVNYGTVSNPKNEGLKDLSTREWAVLAPTVVMAVVMGIAPSVFLNPMKPALDRVIARLAEAGPARLVVTPIPMDGAIPQADVSPRERGAENDVPRVPIPATADAARTGPPTRHKRWGGTPDASPGMGGRNSDTEY